MCVQGVGGSRGQKWGPLAPEADFGLEVPLSLSTARLWMHSCDRMGCSKQPPKHLLGTFTPSIKELSVYHSGGQGGMRGSPLQSKTSHLIAHQRHHPSAMQRGQIPHSCSPLTFSKTPSVLTSSRELLGIDDLGRILLSCQHLHASPDNGESAPGNRRSQR